VRGWGTLTLSLPGRERSDRAERQGAHLLVPVEGEGSVQHVEGFLLEERSLFSLSLWERVRVRGRG